MKRLAVLGCLEAATRRLGVGVADEEDAVGRFADHAPGQLERGGVFGEHPGGHDEKPSLAELDRCRVVAVEHLQVERLVELQAGVLPVGPVGLEVVNLGEHPAKSPDEDRLFAEPPLLHQQGERGQHLLRAPQREGGDQHAAAPLKRSLDRADEFFDLTSAGEVGGCFAGAAGGLHDHHVGLHFAEPGRLEEGLVVHAGVSGVKERLLFAAHHDAGRAERVAGVVKLQRRGDLPPGRLLERAPLDLPVVAVALEQRRELVHLAVAVERVLGDAQFLGLPLHHVDRVVQHALDDEVAQLRHHHVGSREMPQRHRQRADVVVVAMRDGDAVDRAFPDHVVQRQRRAALPLGMRPGIHQQAVAVHLHMPGAGPDARAGVKITQSHGYAWRAGRCRRGTSRGGPAVS